MKTIRSKDNSIYKAALKLTKKKYRDETGEYLVEGIKPVEDALHTGTDINRIFVDETNGQMQQFPENITFCLDHALFGKLSSTEHSQGVIAVAAAGIRSAAEFVQDESQCRINTVILDRLQDPGNVGTIIRTAEAAGYGSIIVMQGTADIYSPKVVRAASGSLFRMKIYTSADESEIIRILKASGKKIISADLDTDIIYTDVDMSENIALVIGNEGKGVSRGFREASDIRVRIPMEGSIESLNAAVAAGILMYQSHNTHRISER